MPLINPKKETISEYIEYIEESAKLDVYIEISNILLEDINNKNEKELIDDLLDYITQKSKEISENLKGIE